MPTNYMQQAHSSDTLLSQECGSKVKNIVGGKVQVKIFTRVGVWSMEKAICQWLCMKNAWAKFCSWRVKDWVTSVSVEDFNSLLFTMHWQGPKIFTFVMVIQ